MNDPIWMLVPWAVFAAASGIKLWRLSGSIRQHRQNANAISTEQFRTSLERIWERDQQAA